MEVEAPSHNIATLRRMADAFGERLEVATVSELSERGVIFVEDGNHGENRPRQDEFVATGIAFLRPPDLKNGRVDFQGCGRISDAGFRRVRKGIGRRGDIILTHRATVGRIAITDSDAPEVFVTNPGTTIWRSTDPGVLDQRYLYCFMRSAAFMDQLWSQVGNNSTFDYVSLTQQRGLRVAYPPIAEQKAIAAVLGALDDKIELNRRMNATLEAMARALFQSWFVDFDPVRAKLDGRTPVGLDPATGAHFPGSFHETAAGHIPHGWRVGSIYEIASVIYGAPFASSLFNTEKLGKPLIRIRDLPNESPAVFTTEMHPKGYLLQPGDIAVGMDGEFRAYLWAGVESWLNQRVCVFTPKRGYSAAFVRNSIIAPLAQVEATETATTVIHLGKNDIDRFIVVIPNAPVAEVFTLQCQPWYDQIVANRRQSRTLATLRDTLLPKLLSGELRVADAERAVVSAS
ncbi:MAG: restriction endonuclease subunit S [Vicinamibacterales bacterium]